MVGEAPDPVFRPVNGRDTHRALANHGLDDNARFLVCLGGLNPHKNLGMLLEVLAQVREQSQFADVQLVLVGPAESDTFTPGAAGLRKRVEQLGLDEAVHITGYLPDEEVVHLLNAARALVMPSLAEGFGLGAVEASACGTPVIATKNSPLPELLEGGGLFFDPENPAELYDALTRLLSDDKKRARMGEKALARSAELTWPRAANQFLALLDTL
ncbi:MAG: glycosyltransferase family 4 protein [Anaerolineales bacterium]